MALPSWTYKDRGAEETVGTGWWETESRKGSHTVPWLNESNPGLGLHPPGPEQHLILLRRWPELVGLEGQLSCLPQDPSILCYQDSLVSEKPWSSEVSLQEFPFQSVSSQVSWQKCPFPTRRVEIWPALRKGPQRLPAGENGRSLLSCFPRIYTKGNSLSLSIASPRY